MGRCLIVALCLFLASAAVVISANRSDDPIGVAVSPQTMLLSSVQGGFVVVHTDVPYSTVDTSTVKLQGVACYAAKPDSCGRLVAYFDDEAIESRIEPPCATLTLTGAKKDGTLFSGSDSVRVVP